MSVVCCTVIRRSRLVGLQGGVEGRLADLDPGGGLADIQPIGQVPHCPLQFVVGDDGLSSLFSPAGGGCGQPRLCTITDQVTLELPQGAEHVEDQPFPGVVVLIASVSDRKQMPRASRVLTTSIRCGSKRPSRYSRHATTTSPARKNARAAVSSGPSALANYMLRGSCSSTESPIKLMVEEPSALIVHTRAHRGRSEQSTRITTILHTYPANLLLC